MVAEAILLTGECVLDVSQRNNRNNFRNCISWRMTELLIWGRFVFQQSLQISFNKYLGELVQLHSYIQSKSASFIHENKGVSMYR